MYLICTHLIIALLIFIISFVEESNIASIDKAIMQHKNIKREYKPDYNRRDYSYGIDVDNDG
jgi:hypothetical protein